MRSGGSERHSVPPGWPVVTPAAALQLGAAGRLDSHRGADLGKHGIAVGKGRRPVGDPVGQ